MAIGERSQALVLTRLRAGGRDEKAEGGHRHRAVRQAWLDCSPARSPWQPRKLRDDPEAETAELALIYIFGSGPAAMITAIVLAAFALFGIGHLIGHSVS